MKILSEIIYYTWLLVNINVTATLLTRRTNINKHRGSSVTLLNFEKSFFFFLLKRMMHFDLRTKLVTLRNTPETLRLVTKTRSGCRGVCIIIQQSAASEMWDCFRFYLEPVQQQPPAPLRNTHHPSPSSSCHNASLTAGTGCRFSRLQPLNQ